MKGLGNELGKVLRLKACDNGWEPQKGTEIQVMVDSGVGTTISYDKVKRLSIVDGGWAIWHGDHDVVWVMAERLISVGSQKVEETGQTGFG